MQVPAQDRQSCRFGPFTVDLVSREIRNGGKVQLQEQPFQILAILLEQPGQLVTREELQQRLWPAGTFVDFDHSINTAIKKLREALEDDAEQPRFIETLPRRGYRFIGQLEETIDESPTTPAGPATPNTWQTQLRRRWFMPFAVAVISGALLFVGLHLAGVRDRWLHGKITEHDTILLADFVNKTGDPVFDGTLKQALAVELGQSPFLNLVSERKVAATLRLMGRDINGPVTVDVARELCQRTGSKAVLNGTISSLGTHYLVNLDALACATGDSLAREEVEAERKEDVLKVLDLASSSLRSKLGESLPSVQKYDVPFEAATSSLEALKNYTVAKKVLSQEGDGPSIPFFKRAIEFDPNFALAYANLGTAYRNLAQPSLALEYASKAYRLRDHATELEKLEISAVYFGATGELDKEIQTYQLWEANYPDDPVPYANLGADYSYMGQYEKALSASQEALHLEPAVVFRYTNLACVYLYLNRPEEAKATLDQALSRKLDSADVRQLLYAVAFMRRDNAQMELQVAWGAGKPGQEDIFFSMQSDTDAYHGRLSKARKLSSRAVDSAIRAESKEVAAFWQINAALREAELGNAALARQGVTAALKLSTGRDAKVLAALTLARTGDIRRAEPLEKEVERSYPADTMLKLYWLPTIRAAVELGRNNSSRALADLESAAPYELGTPLPFNNLYPAYVRGQAYLVAHNGPAAAAEFQKMLDHPGIVLNGATGALAHLQLGRAYAMSKDTTKAKAAYQDFLALWKDAEPDVPILKQAKVEYAKLQ
jgi:DNA-binding winged helix-turn-helix (wHTH) protein/tetratricopeptide (TPR) repeat protein